MMAASYLNRFLAIMRSLERELTAMFGGLSDETVAVLIRAANADGVITTDALFSIQQTIGQAVMRRFVGRTGAGTMAPFLELPTGEIFPLSQYSRILIDHAKQVEALAIEQQQAFMLKFTPEAFKAQLQQTPLFRPNPLAQYDKLHTWVDPNGYQLSDRIWRTGGQTRRQLDAFLD
ncbi:MAG TPA: hypothetical protein VKA67_13770, partial [Verrucomicrobiae bacterium]|nr:hypothetical protein [Verrucomicrobiae bacterium]